MSITNSLWIGISGLESHGDAIGVVGDNIANASTIGYKRSRASFADLLGGEIGQTRAGGGVHLSGTQTMWDQGAINQTGNPLDLAIRGGGFFMVKGNHDGQDGTYYTRDGRFQLDNQGYVTDGMGLKLQGYSIDGNGNRATTVGDLALGSRQSPPSATTSAKMALNLDKAAPLKPTWDPTNPVGTSNYATSQTVYDSLGTAHHVDVYFRAQGNGSWEWHAMVDGGELTGGTQGVATEIASGAMTFDTTGALQTQTTNNSSANFAGATQNQVINFNFGDDVASGGTGRAGTTQWDGNGISTITSSDVDGKSFGKLTSISIGADGMITGQFDNGDKLNLAQVALADFPNQDGLARLGDGLVGKTPTSGSALVDVPGTGSRGAISSGALEASNVDLGNELVTLIAYQRAFQANAKTVTTADEMMNDVNNLKR